MYEYTYPYTYIYLYLFLYMYIYVYLSSILQRANDIIVAGLDGFKVKELVLGDLFRYVYIYICTPGPCPR
jgi:hypothetical protein